MAANKNQGWAKIAWSMGFNKLRKLTTVAEEGKLCTELFKEYMYDIISKGGDTDTNAAIVGQVVGAVVGFCCLPNDYV